MSIAVSAVVRPSRILFALQAAMSSMALLIAIGIVSGYLGNAHISYRIPVAALPLFLGCFGFYHGIRYRKPIHIDISGAGQFRLVQLAADSTCADRKWPHVRKNGEVVRLLNDSTFWPHVLVLRLMPDSGKVTTILVLPDSVSQDCFRALSVACRWVAAHGDSTGSREV